MNMLFFIATLLLSAPLTEELPTRIMIGYWQNWGSGGNPFIKLRDVCDSWDVINIAFAVPVQPGSRDGKMKFTLDGPADYTYDEFKSDIKLLQSRGKKIVLSIGGYTGYFNLPDQAAVNQFVSDIKGIIDTYGFDGIDMDLEQNSIGFDVGNDPDIRVIKSPLLKNVVEAVRTICHSYGDDFILSWAPETIDAQMGYEFYAGIIPCDARSGAILPMVNALRKETTFLQVQLYNSGSITGPDGKLLYMGTKEGIVGMCKMLLDGFYVGAGRFVPKTDATWFAPLRPDQVVIAVPASKSAAGSGQISNPDLQAAYAELNQNYPAVRGIMAWDINWDKAENGNTFATENKAFLNRF